MGGRVEEKPAETYGLFDTIPLALKDISTALIDRIRDRWPDCEDRPRELSPENLRQLAEQVGEFAGAPFLRFADEILRDRAKFVQYLLDCEQWSREDDLADALAEDRPAYRLWENPKRCQPGDVARTGKTGKKRKPK